MEIPPKGVRVIQASDLIEAYHQKEKVMFSIRDIRGALVLLDSIRWDERNGCTTLEKSFQDRHDLSLMLFQAIPEDITCLNLGGTLFSREGENESKRIVWDESDLRARMRNQEKSLSLFRER